MEALVYITTVSTRFVAGNTKESSATFYNSFFFCRALKIYFTKQDAGELKEDGFWPLNVSNNETEATYIHLCL